MKILEINKFHFAKGGADKHFLDLVNLLESQGHEVAVFSMEHEKNTQTKWSKYFVSKVGYTQDYSFWEKIKGAFRMFYSFEANKKLGQLLDEFKPDIVHVHNAYHQIPPSVLFQIKKRNIPIVMTVHDFKIISPNHSLFHNGQIYKRARGGKFYECFLDKCIKNSYVKSFLAMLEAYWHKFLGSYEKNVDLYLAPSNFVKKILVESGMKKGKIEVLPHFITFSQRHMNDKSEIKERYAIYCGRLSKNKGILTLMNIFEKDLGVKLYLAGEVEDDIEVNNRKNVKYLGYLNSLMLKKYIKDAEFVISGSQLPETFGLVALEAISLGKPFVGFRTGGYEEIIENGENGFLVSDEKEMREIIEKIAKKEVVFDKDRIIENAKSSYSREKYLEKLSKIIDEVGGFMV